jgi:hypothetical protein
VTLARKDGKVVLEEKPADCDLAEEDLGIGPDLDVLLPGKPVGAGDRWEVDPQKLATLFDRDAPRKVAGTCTLVRVAVEGGVRLARMQVSVTLEGEEKGTTISAALEGSFVFDVDLGRAVSASWRGRVKMAREKMVLEGPIELEAAITPAG